MQNNSNSANKCIRIANSTNNSNPHMGVMPHMPPVQAPLLDSRTGKYDMFIDTLSHPARGVPAHKTATGMSKNKEGTTTTKLHLCNSQNDSSMGVKCIALSCNDDCTSDSDNMVRDYVTSSPCVWAHL